MYSWRERSDTHVYDEPFYAHYLNLTGREHPAFEVVVAGQSTDAQTVIDEVILGPCDRPVYFIKQMAHHLLGVPRHYLSQTDNILLTRTPAEMLTSLSVQVPDCGLADTGLAEQVELLDAILKAGGHPIVVDSTRLLMDPEGVLAQLCERLGLDFEPAMLTWPAGPKPEDGLWAPEWYDNVHRSTGFAAPYGAKNDPLPTRLEPILAEADELYQRLANYALA